MQQQRSRSGIMVGLLSLGLLVGAALTAGPAQADSVGPYYATPSWDQTLPSATRFIILSNFASEAVLDRNTGLVWARSQSFFTGWLGAINTCLGNRTGGQMGWRLPAITELASLIDISVDSPGPTLPTGHPFRNFSPGRYWSITTSVDPFVGFYAADFTNGEVTSNPDRNTRYNAWCVRGGNSADQH